MCLDIDLKPIWCHLALKVTLYFFFSHLSPGSTHPDSVLVPQIHKNECNSVSLFHKEAGGGKEGENQIKK